jgi:hypothetical protein
MRVCAVCGALDTQKCHVKDKGTFEANEHDDFHNIIFLCASHHYEFFDQARLAIDPISRTLLLLKCIRFRRIEIAEPRSAVAIKPEYIRWKNRSVHTFLKAELRKRQNAVIASTSAGAGSEASVA